MRWEMFEDHGYYGMWAVRPIGDTRFSSPQLFHFATKAEAESFRDLAGKAKVAVPKACRHYYGGPNGSTCYGCGKSNHAV
jgi:hypothetical protein